MNAWLEVVANGALLALAVALVIPVLVLLLQVVAATALRRRIEPVGEAWRRPRIAVLMPAHDEASGIAVALATVRPQLAAGDRLLVVADNCGDDTAQVASLAGAEVVQRTDASRRGKGYALDHGVRYLANDPPEIVVIVDADCALAGGALDLLARSCAVSGRPTQALYLMRAPPPASLRLRIAEFAWIVKNQVRPLGSRRLGWPCQLMGTGMAFPWKLIASAPLASGHLVEDLQLGLDLAAAGAAPQFCVDALVTSVFPADAQSASVQRTRWEHGHLATIVSQVPRSLWQALRQGRAELALLALDAAVPPLASLSLLLSAVALASLLLLVLGGSALPTLLTAGSMLLLASAVALAWRAHGREVVSARELLSIPAYVLGKLPIYWGALRKRQLDWIRTKR